MNQLLRKHLGVRVTVSVHVSTYFDNKAKGKMERKVFKEFKNKYGFHRTALRSKYIYLQSILLYVTM